MTNNDIKNAMQKAMDHMKTEFSKLRVGRASTAMVEGVRVEQYGSQMALKEVAAINVADARTLTIQPWDRSVLGDIEKAILASNLGLTPQNDGKIIRIVMPPMTEENRKNFVKQIKTFGEEAKVSVRNTRRDAIDGEKKKKEKSEDEMRRFQEEVQKLTDQYSGDIDKLVEAKSKEVMTI